jgi:hypothetical protein
MHRFRIDGSERRTRRRSGKVHRHSRSRPSAFCANHNAAIRGREREHDDAHRHDWCNGRSVIRDDVRPRPRASANRDQELICRRKRQSTQLLQMVGYNWSCLKPLLAAPMRESTYSRPAIDNAASELIRRMQELATPFLNNRPARSPNADRRLGRPAHNIDAFCRGDTLAQGSEPVSTYCIGSSK